MNRTLSLILFLALTLGFGLAFGYLTQPGEWYAGLNKPVFNPPAWLFAPVWTVLYILIAIAGWRIWQVGANSTAMMLWWVQMILNFAWTPIFFSAHQVGIAFAAIIVLLIAIIGFIISAWDKDRVAAWLFVPYAAWVGFASMVNGAIWTLN